MACEIGRTICFVALKQKYKMLSLASASLGYSAGLVPAQASLRVQAPVMSAADGMCVAPEV